MQVSFFLNTPAPVAQKVADEVVFRRFLGEVVDFFSIGSPQIFDVHLFENTNFSPFRLEVPAFIFQWIFIS